MIRRWLPWMVVGFWGAMFIGTHIPPVGMPNLGSSDKTLHLVSFAILAWLMINWVGAKAALRIVLILAIYAVFDEITQPIFGRTADLRDWLADLAGACAGVMAGLFFKIR